MRVLAFDCAGAQCAGAIVTNGRPIAQRRIVAERGHARLLLPMLCDLLSEAHLAFGDIDRYAVTTGPGSFTGIRVALATARGLALATDAPVVGVTVFDAVAAKAAAAGISTPRLLIAVESRRAACFVQMFGADGKAAGTPCALEPDDLAAWTGPEPLTIAGDAATRIAPYLPGGFPMTGDDAAFDVDAVTVARLAVDRPVAAPPSPFYLRPPDAAPAGSSWA